MFPDVLFCSCEANLDLTLNSLKCCIHLICKITSQEIENDNAAFKTKQKCKTIRVHILPYLLDCNQTIKHNLTAPVEISTNCM